MVRRRKSTSSRRALLGYIEATLAFVAEHADHVRAVLEVSRRTSAERTASRR